RERAARVRGRPRLAPARALPGPAGRVAARRLGGGAAGPCPARSACEGGPVSATLRVNPITCEAHGLCAELLPELIRLDDWGYPILDESEVPPDLVGLARRAVDACPTLALLIDES